MDDELRRQEAEPVAWPQGFFTLRGDARLRECATDICSQSVSVRVELGGIGSDYCEPCARKIAEMNAPAPAVPVEGAPERICAWAGDEQDGWENAYATTHHVANGQVEYVRADIALRAQPAPQVKAVPWKVWDKLCHLFAETLAHVDEGIIHDESREAFFALKNEAHTALSGEAQ